MHTSDVGQLKHGDMVTVNGRAGTVIDIHEPSWVDHKTKAFRKVLQGADIRLDGEKSSYYIHAADIDKSNVELTSAAHHERKMKP